MTWDGMKEWAFAVFIPAVVWGGRKATTMSRDIEDLKKDREAIQDDIAEIRADVKEIRHFLMGNPRRRSE